MTRDIIDHYYADNVVYLELHVKPCVSVQLTPETFLRKMIQAITAAKRIYHSMIIKVLVIVELETSIEKVQEAIDLVMILGKKSMESFLIIN